VSEAQRFDYIQVDLDKNDEKKITFSEIPVILMKNYSIEKFSSVKEGYSIVPKENPEFKIRIFNSTVHKNINFICEDH